MAIKSADQITVLDITDGYTVNLSMDSISLNGGTGGLPSAQTVNVVVTALRGTSQITPSVTKRDTDSSSVWCSCAWTRHGPYAQS